MEIALMNLSAAKLRKKILAWQTLTGRMPAVLVGGTLEAADDSDPVFANGGNRLIVKAVRRRYIVVIADDHEVPVRPESAEDFVLKHPTGRHPEVKI